MSSQSMPRRDFIKVAGLGAAAVGLGVTAPTIIANTSRGHLVESPEEYGGFLVEKLTDDAVGFKFPYETKPEVLKQMPQAMNGFNRRRPRVQNPIMSEIPNSRLDHALHDASWLVARTQGMYKWCNTDLELHNRSSRSRRDPSSRAPSIEEIPIPALDARDKWQPEDSDLADWAEVSLAVKHAALFYGASLAGIAKLNRLWLYAETKTDGERYGKFREGNYIPESMNYVIAMAFEEDFHGINNSTGKLASAATGNGYSRMAFTASTLADFIGRLGYRAIPSGNGDGPSIPCAIDAGLGQVGRNGLIVTPKYGPRVRLAKVYTDMPLVADPPIDFGVTEFCDVCMTCAQECPSDSIPEAERTWEGKSPSNNPGVKKWYIEPDPCNDYNGFSCSNCKRHCPYTKPNNSWLHRMSRRIINARIDPLNQAFVKLDKASGYGSWVSQADFWKMDGSTCITARDKM